MIKTIKVKKKLRLDELIKYVIDKGLNGFQFTSDNNVDVYFSSNGHFIIAGDRRSVELADTYTVEVEEEITEYTVFQSVVILDSNRINHLPPNKYYYSIRSVRRDYPTVTEIHAIVNGKLELIYERSGSDE